MTRESLVQADELGIIYAKYPQLTAASISGRSVEISGKVLSCSLGGMEKEIAEVQLDTGGKANVYVYRDLGKMGRNHSLQWKENGGSVSLVENWDNGKSYDFSSSGETFKARVILKRQTASSLYFDFQAP